MNIIYKVITTVLSPINISDINSDDKAALYDFVDMILTNANSLIDLFLPYTLAKVLLFIVLAIEAAITIYKIVMWVIRKIPMGGIT